MPVKPPLVIAQISDFHVAIGPTPYDVDTAAGVERCIAQLNAAQPRPDFVVISGDLVEDGTAEEYRLVRQLLEPLKIPYAVIPGNHDARGPMREAFPDQSFVWPDGALDSLVRVGPLDLVLLDSSKADVSYGLLEERTLDWLEATLSADHDRPAIVFVHHPPFETGVPPMDRLKLRNADQLGAVLARHSRVRLLAAGHVHRAVSTMFAGVRATIAPSVNYATVFDIADLIPPYYVHEPPGFYAHCWLGDGPKGEVVTHMIPIGEFKMPPPPSAAKP